MHINKRWIIILCATFALIGITAAIAFVVTQPNQQGTADLPNLSTQREINIKEIAAHSTATDCWTYIGGMVFDATKVIAANTQYADYLVRACGADGSSVYTVLKYSEQPLERQTIVQLREQLGEHQVGLLSL